MASTTLHCIDAITVLIELSSVTSLTIILFPSYSVFAQNKVPPFPLSIYVLTQLMGDDILMNE